MFSVKFLIQNHSKKPRILYIEPWAYDFTLLPGQEFSVVATSDSKPPWISGIAENNHSIQVFIEGGTFQVFHKKDALETGHNRQAALDAGLTF